jgi:pimeloyl-ACP methyl ester carboxylesterase
MPLVLNRRRAAILSLCGIAAPLIGRTAEPPFAIVLLHGKQGSPGYLAGLARDLRSEGWLVAVPTMPWSQAREYDISYPQALDEIEAAANPLVRQGASRVVVGGHSLGANAALAYAAAGRSVYAVFGLAPGHVPERGGFRRGVAPGVEKAREMIARGAGDEKAMFPDLNQGQSRQIRITAKSYLSYFDPEGLGSMPRSAASIAKPLPIFMAVGDSDSIAGYARTEIFDVAPKHEKSVYNEGPGDHLSTIRIAAPALIGWLKGLTA